jgi:hypothetical protein
VRFEPGIMGFDHLLSQKHSFETRPGPTGRPGTPADPGWVDEKTGEGKTRCDPADPAGRPGDPARPGQDPMTNPLTFVFFFTKTTSF